MGGAGRARRQIRATARTRESDAADKESTELAIMLCRYLALQRQEEEDAERKAHAARRGETKKDT
eukprot:3051561-Prymnesium_polylepis.2